MSTNPLNDLSKVYLDRVATLNTDLEDKSVKRWEDMGGPTPGNYKADNNSAKLSQEGRKLKVGNKEQFSNWRGEGFFEAITTPTTDSKALRKIDEKGGIKNKVEINPKLKEAVTEMGGELLGVKEETDAQLKKQEKEVYRDEKKDAQSDQVAAKEKRANMIKRQVLLKKMQAVRQGAGDTILASYDPMKSDWRNDLEEAKVDRGKSDAEKAEARNKRNTPAGQDKDTDLKTFIARKPGESLGSARARVRRKKHEKQQAATRLAKSKERATGALKKYDSDGDGKVRVIDAGYNPEGEIIDERLGGKGFSRKAASSGIHKTSGDWPESDRGEGNKARRRAGEKVEKKSPTYLAHVHNKKAAVGEGKSPEQSGIVTPEERERRRKKNTKIWEGSREDRDPPPQFEKGDDDRGNPDYMKSVSYADEKKWERLQRMRRASKKKEVRSKVQEGKIADALRKTIADMKAADRKAGLLPGGKDVVDLDVERERRRKKKVDEGKLTSVKATTYGMPPEERKAHIDAERKRLGVKPKPEKKVDEGLGIPYAIGGVSNAIAAGAKAWGASQAAKGAIIGGALSGAGSLAGGALNYAASRNRKAAEAKDKKQVKKKVDEEVGISSSAAMEKARKEAKLKAKEEAAVKKAQKIKEDKQGLDKYDRHKRMIRHKQDKYGRNVIGADYNLENERKAKGWKKKLNKEDKAFDSVLDQLRKKYKSGVLSTKQDFDNLKKQNASQPKRKPKPQKPLTAAEKAQREVDARYGRTPWNKEGSLGT